MIRDYPDSVPLTSPGSSPSMPSSPFLPSQSNTTAPLLLSPTVSSSGQVVTGSGTGTPNSSLTPSPASSVTSLPLTSSMSAHTGPPAQLLTSPQAPPFSGPILPPPTHPSMQPMQTTYTPYVPRSKRGKPAASTGIAGSPALGNVPIITTSVRGGVTAVNANGVSARLEKAVDVVKGNGRSAPQRASTYSHGPSAALLDKVRALDNLPRLGSLRTLDLKGNDLRSGTSYLAQVLKRNRTLKVLNLSENKLDVACLVAIADALKYNTCLETLDLSRNPCCGSGSSSGSGSLTRDRDRNLTRDSSALRSDKSLSDLEGLQSLRTSLTLTTSLKRLFLSSTNLSTQGAIALAEFLPECRSLLHLDLTGNQDLGVAGVMALNEGLKRNKIIRCLDLEVPPGAEEYTRLCREILNTCIRNTEEAEKASQREQVVDQSGGRAKAALWGMIEESELAKSVRLAGDEVGTIDTDVVLRARGCVRQLTSYIKTPSQPLHSPSHIPSTPRSPQSPGFFSPTSSFAPFSMLSGSESQARDDQAIITPEELISKARKVTNELASVVAQIMSGENGVDPERLEELLNINDELSGLVTKAESTQHDRSTSPEPVIATGTDTESKSGRPSLTLEGLSHFSRGNGEAQARVKELVSGSENLLPSTRGEIDDAQSPATPRVDKGKQKAAPEPIEHEKVLSPTSSFLVSEANSDSEDEDVILDSRFPPFRMPDSGEEGYIPEDERIISPSSTDRSKIWVEEEGEVFRKGNVLLGPEEMEGEYDGEELRRELLEAMVERPAPRNLSVDEFGVETAPELPQEDTVDDIPEPVKQVPRPYISRSRSSSSSIMSLVSPTIEKAAALPLPASPRVDSPIPTALKSPTPSSLPGTPTSEINSPFRPYSLRTKTSNSSLNAK